MKRSNEMPAPMPPRKELSDNPVKLCNEIGRLWRHRIRSSDRSDGVMSQPGAHLILAVLAIHDGINQLELVRQTHLRAPTVSVILKKMEHEGLVERTIAPDDKRVTLIHLTERGRVLDGEKIERIRALDLLALEGLSDEEQRILMALLPKIRDNLLRAEEGEKEGRRENGT